MSISAPHLFVVLAGVVLACLASLASADVSFTAQVVRENDTYVHGFVTGRIQYFYNSTAGATNHRLRYDWSIPGYSPVEVILWSRSTRYKKCGDHCDAETYKLPPLRFFRDRNSDTATGNPADRDGCEEFKRAGDAEIGSVWANSVTGALCRVVFRSGVVLRVVPGSYAAGVVSEGEFDVSAWGCPAPVCNRIMDVILVIDHSPTIEEDPKIGKHEWTDSMNFAKSIVNSFTISATASTMGIVWFDDIAATGSDLSADASALTKILNGRRPADNQGYTCIACGMNLALDRLRHPISKSRENTYHPRKMMIVLTDGKSNFPKETYKTELKDAAKAAVKGDVLVITVGVGDALDPNQLETIATKVPGLNTTLYAKTFSELPKIVGQLVSQTCTDLPAQPCGKECYGFCYCDRVCLCPNCREYKCNPQKCDASTYHGCTYPALKCPDSGHCQLGTCKNDTGCTTYTRPCDDGLHCTDDQCSEAAGGCIAPPTKCADNPTKCMVNQCDKGSGKCLAVELGSEECKCKDFCKEIPCKVSKCSLNPQTKEPQCAYEDLVCDPGSECALAVCNVTTGKCQYSEKSCDDHDPCTKDLCDPLTGCYNPPGCDDENPCTNDTCVAGVGCAHTPKCDDGLFCTEDVCLLGGECEQRPTECPDTLTGGDKSCFSMVCSEEKRTCKKRIVQNAWLDPCGECANNQTFNNSSCVAVWDTPKLAAALSAAAIAGIVVAAVVAAIIVLAAGAAGTAVLVQRAGAASNMSAITNPLYAPQGSEFTNAAFSGSA